MNGQLFALDSVLPSPGVVGWQAIGTSAQMLATSKLLELGYKVAIPVTDDDGVDLIVNYCVKVQVKSCASRRENGVLQVALRNRRKGRGTEHVLGTHVDVVAVYARDTGNWWIIPRDVLGLRNRLYLWDTPAQTGPRPWDPYLNAWSVMSRVVPEPE